MAHRLATILGTAAGTLGLLGAVVALSGSSDEPDDPAIRAVAGLPVITDFSIGDGGDGCVYDPARGGLVHEGLTVTSQSTGVLELSFFAQGESLDEVLPGYVTTVLTFDADTHSRTFDLVVPVSQADHDAGYVNCEFTTTGR